MKRFVIDEFQADAISARNRAAWRGSMMTTQEDLRASETKSRAAKVWPNKVTYVDGIRFQSRLEARYYSQLKLRHAAGEFAYFLRQVPLFLEGGVKYVVDFMLVNFSSPPTFVDTTGRMTLCKSNKLRQVKARYGIEVEIVTKVTQ